MKKTWFISDLHLDPSQPHLFKLFYEFIDEIHEQADALYILGDLFEFWIGDDIIGLPAGEPFLPVIQKLKGLSDSGVKIYFIQGNRDFLLQQRFMQAIGATLLPDSTLIDLYGKPTLIMHGDTLCIDDKAYQLMRVIFRLKLVQKLYLMFSPERRSRKANKVRQTTSKLSQNKSSMILDVSQSEVERMMMEYGAIQLIHGHTHRPAIHQFDLNGKIVKRMVLGDWGEKSSFIGCDEDGCCLEF